MRKSSVVMGMGFLSAIVTGLLAMHSSANANSVPVTPTPAITVTELRIPECATEDSDNCIWNAESRGNGKGQSFISYQGKVYYLR